MVTTSSAYTGSSVGQPPSTRYAYDPPAWAKDKFRNLPQSGRLNLANLPSPLYKLASTSPTQVPEGDSILQRLARLDVTLYVKRDDMTGGCETGGNKIRKLEFLLADALERGYQSVVTIGGEQSNHCRATAAACRMVGLEPHLILRTRRADDIQQQAENIGFTGNVLLDRMVGSGIYTCTPREYGTVGSSELVSRLCEYLEKNNGKGEVYPIPVGGSNGCGTWGYLEGVNEMLSQWDAIEEKPSLDHVVFACGSGGTAAGICLGTALAHGALDNTLKIEGKSTSPHVHAVGVCDDPDYFYRHVAEIADEMGLVCPDGVSVEDFVRSQMIVHQGRGKGYASSTPEELDFIAKLAMETGLVLDPVYSGKALYHFVNHILEGDDAESYRGKNVLFWHTGGVLGLFDKGNDLLSTMNAMAPAKRLDVYGNGLENGISVGRPESSD